MTTLNLDEIEKALPGLQDFLEKLLSEESQACVKNLEQLADMLEKRRTGDDVVMARGLRLGASMLHARGTGILKGLTP